MLCGMQNKLVLYVEERKPGGNSVQQLHSEELWRWTLWAVSILQRTTE